MERYRMTPVLAIDIGNSMVKFARIEHHVVVGRVNLPTESLRTLSSGSDLLVAAPGLDVLTANAPLGALGSVVRWAGERVVALIESLGCPVRVITSPDFAALGLRIEYRNTEPGVDRMAASAEAFARGGGPLVVVGVGTAVHTNVVTAEGVYRGGAIMPGLRLMSESLGDGTDQIGIVEPRQPSRVIGDSTPECVEIGLYYGWLGGVLMLVEETCRELGSNPKVWLYGGQSGWIAPRLPDAQVGADLGVLGLARVSDALG
jgi:type III pantothenate kinase